MTRLAGRLALPAVLLAAGCASSWPLAEPPSEDVLRAVTLGDEARLGLRGFESASLRPVRSGVAWGPSFAFGLGSGMFGGHAAQSFAFTHVPFGTGAYTEYEAVPDASARTVFRRLLEDVAFAGRVEELPATGAPPEGLDYLLEGAFDVETRWHGWSYGTFIPYVCTLFLPTVLGAPFTFDIEVTVTLRAYDGEGRFLRGFAGAGRARYWQSIYRERAAVEARSLAFHAAAAEALAAFGGWAEERRAGGGP